MYYEIWQQFDPDGTQYIKYAALSDFLDVLEPPLQIHKPNKYKIISMDIPICKGDLCFCVDVLDALTKDFFARKGNPVEETAELGEVTAHVDRPEYEPISSTLWRQREDYCARLIQGAWRRSNRQQRRFLEDLEEEEEEDYEDEEDEEEEDDDDDEEEEEEEDDPEPQEHDRLVNFSILSTLPYFPDNMRTLFFRLSCITLAVPNCPDQPVVRWSMSDED